MSEVDRTTIAAMTQPPPDRRRKLFLKAMKYADTYGLNRDDRIELARVLLWRDVTSWKNLTEDQLLRILDSLEGYLLVTHLIGQHPQAGE